MFLNFPVHQHNFHVPECPCDEDAPENENDLFLNISVLNVVLMFLNTKLLECY